MTDKTLVDVLDNTVNQISNGVQTLSNSIQKIAPDAWKILVHRQKILAYNDIALGLLLFIAACLCIFLYKKTIYKYFVTAIEKDEDFLVGQILCGIAFAVGIIIVLCFSANHISNGFVRYNSAEYNAVQDLIYTVKP